jgi:hypothetical protein
VTYRIIHNAPFVLVGPEIANIVRRLHDETDFHCFLMEFSKQRHQVEKLVGLQQKFWPVRGIAHGHGELYLPVSGTGLNDCMHQGTQLRHHLCSDLGAHTARYAAFLQVSQYRNRLIE